MARGGAKGDQRPIIIKKVKKVAGGHHGGAWKVAYADFVTAMMAFFMLLWLLTVTDKQTLKGVADYFTPSKATMSNSSGSGNILAGTSLQKDGANNSGSVAIAQQETPSTKDDTRKNTAKATQDSAMQLLQQDLQNAIQSTPTLADYKNQIIMDVTPEGLRIQLVDKDGRPMFRDGTAELFPYAVSLVRVISSVVSALPNRISVEGHTDTSGNGTTGYSNWELSADRANAARRVMREARVSDFRFAEIVGKASSDPLYPDTPARAENRRVAFIILNEAPVVAPGFGD